MEKEYLRALIKKVLAGSATPEEKAELEEQWQQSLRNERIIESLSEAEREELRALMYRNVWQAIGEREGESRQASRADQRLVRSPFRRLHWAVAASVAFLMLSAGITFYFLSNDSMTSVQTAMGQRREIVLPDQSVVTLNGNSTIRYARAWNNDQIREVWLEGEAYFSVQHTVNHQKFLVHTPDQLQVEVLGTKFNVLNRHGDTQIVLQEGKVKVSDTKQQYVMKPGEMVQYSTRQAKLIPTSVNPTPVISWKDKVRFYRDETLASIFQGLKESHGIRVEFQNEALGTEIFNGSVPSDSVEVLFEKIEKLYQVKVTKKEGVYLIQ